MLNKNKTPFSSNDDGNDENDEKNWTNIFSNWRQWFNGKDTGDKYEKQDNKDNNIDNYTSVGILNLFRFADRIDLLLMFIVGCLVVLHSCCVLANYVLCGRLAGLFAMKSFDDSCQHQHQNPIIPNISNYICPLGIELHPSNYNRLHKLCRNNDGILSATSDLSMSSFRAKVMNLVYWLLITGIIEFVVVTIEYFIWMLSMKRQTSRMSIGLFKSLLQRNITYWDTNPTSRSHTKLFDSITKIEQGIGLEFLVLIIILLTTVFTVIVSFVINWQLTLIILCLMPIIFISSFMFSKVTINGAINELNAYSKAGQIAQEVFSALRTVLSLNGSKFEQNRYEKELHPTYWANIRQGAVYGVFVGWLSLSSFIVYSVGFIFGSMLMSFENENTLNISDIIIIVSLFAQTARYFSFIGPFIQSFSQARGAAASVLQLIDEAHEANMNETEIWDDSMPDKELAAIVGDIRFDNVNFVYPSPSRKDVPVLNDLNLIARVGQTTALVGPSGCGKSTCISLLLRYYEPTSGRITINNQLNAVYNLRQLRQNIGVVSQEPILFGMSIYENIRFGKLNATRIEIEEAARQANAHHFIMQLPNKYETLVGERGIQLSGGEKQRIALARALIKQPTILLLDEATSALDNVSEKIVQEALDQACKGRTAIIIAHRLSTIRNADYIYVLDNGSIVEEGTHETLMAKEEGKYQAMVKKQQLESTSNDKDEQMNMKQVIEEDQKQMLECSPILNNSQTVHTNKESSTLSDRRSIFLRLLSMNSPEWIIILIGCITCSLNGAAQSIFAILLAKIVNAFKGCAYSQRHHQVLISSFFFLLLGVIILVLRLLQYIAFVISGSKLTHRIRSKTFACLLRQEIAYFDQPENNSGAICARLSSDALALQQITGIRLGAVCESIALSCFGLLLGIFFNWQLSIVVFISILIYSFFSYLHIRLGIGYSQECSSIRTRTSTLAAEATHNIHTIKQLSLEKEILQRYSQLSDQMFILSWGFFLRTSLIDGALWGLDAWISAVIYWWTLILFERDEIKSNEIIMVFAFASLAVQAFRIIRLLSRQIGRSVSAARSFFDLFDRTPVIDNTSMDGQKLNYFRGNIEFNQVKFTYPTRPTSIVLNDFQLSIKPGQCVALVGASGCGKSTIIQLLERFYDVIQGQLLLDGIDIRQLNIQWIRSRVGLVSQEPTLFDLTIAQNIAYGLENVPMEDIITAATKANIHHFIQQLPQGYETKVGLKGSFLSGGEKQRIAIARALLRQPKVLLLDEATSAMDSYNEQIVQQALVQAQTEDPSRTSLIIAHRLSTIRSCDLICVLDKGYIVESGSHAELLQRRGAYYKMIVEQT